MSTSVTLSATRPSLASRCLCSASFFFNDTATTEIYTLSLHDALPISQTRVTSSPAGAERAAARASAVPPTWPATSSPLRDRKSTRLNSSHMSISYAVFCLKKKTDRRTIPHHDTSGLTRLPSLHLAQIR